MPNDHDALSLAATTDAALCTIVGIEGSFSRRVGAQLAIGRDGALAGDLSDNCLHGELVAQVEQARAEGRARTMRFGRGSPQIDFRLACGAGLDVLIDPAPDRRALAACVAALGARQAGQVPLADNPHLAARAYIPPPRLVILGAGAEAAALARLASRQGIAVEQRGPGYGLGLGRAPEGIPVDPWTAVVLLFHDHEWERAPLEWALAGPAYLIGAQGGAPARADRIAGLRAAGHDAAALARIVSPVGLIPRARDPDVLALSILAQIVAAHEALHPHR